MEAERVAGGNASVEAERGTVGEESGEEDGTGEEETSGDAEDLGCLPKKDLRRDFDCCLAGAGAGETSAGEGDLGEVLE